MKAWDLFLTDVGEGTLSHAYLIYGVDSIATSRFLKDAAAAVVCTADKKPCGKCLDCQKVANGTHPDVYKISDAKKILVDDITALVESAYVRPIESGCKVYVIEGMEQANEKAQNKLLKILEDPVKNTVFLLSAANLQFVLPTVQSRVKKLAAEENPSFLLEDRSAEHTAVRKSIVEMYQNMRASKDILDFVNIFSRIKDLSTGFLGFLELVTRDMILCNAGKDDLVLNKDQKDDIMSAAEDFSTTALTNILGHIANRRKDLGVNTNSTPVLDKLLYSILEEKHKCPR